MASKVIALLLMVGLSTGCITYRMNATHPSTAATLGLLAFDFGVPALASIAPLEDSNTQTKFTYPLRYFLWTAVLLFADGIIGLVAWCSDEAHPDRCDNEAATQRRPPTQMLGTTMR